MLLNSLVLILLSVSVPDVDLSFVEEVVTPVKVEKIQAEKRKVVLIKRGNNGTGNKIVPYKIVPYKNTGKL